MLAWIISTAQQARPNAIHHKEPVRAHWSRYSGAGASPGVVAGSSGTAQQARPNVIHHKEPVRAHWNRSSVEVTRKPLSATSELRSLKKAGSGCWRSDGRRFS